VEAIYENTQILCMVLPCVLLFTAIIKQAFQIAQFYIFKSKFLKLLIRMHEKNDIELSESFDVSKKKLVYCNIQNALEENSKQAMKNIFDLRDTVLITDQNNKNAEDEDEVFLPPNSGDSSKYINLNMNDDNYTGDSRYENVLS
jgi:hypothetical protein